MSAGAKENPGCGAGAGEVNHGNGQYPHNTPNLPESQALSGKPGPGVAMAMSNNLTIETIRAVLTFLHPGDAVSELCTIGPKAPQSPLWEGFAGGKNPIVAGWFKDHDKVAALAPQVQAKGVYVTLNPCQEALLSRANERLIAQMDRTKDAEISHIRNLLIDVDPGEAVKGISSTDVDHDAALAMAEVIRADLEKEGGLPPSWGTLGTVGT